MAVAAELKGRLERQGHASNRSSALPCSYRSGWGQQREKELEAHTRPHRQVCPSLVKPGNDKPALHTRWLHHTVLGNPAADSDHATVGEFWGEGGRPRDTIIPQEGIQKQRSVVGLAIQRQSQRAKSEKCGELKTVARRTGKGVIEKIRIKI